MTTYTQPEKDKVRWAALAEAVGLLTVERSSSCCVRESYVRELRNWLLGCDHELDRKFAADLSDERTETWEGFHRSKVGTRSMSELVVCYLCGPEPLNDLRVLVALGIQPHNIWAFESDNTSYAAAVDAVRRSGFPMLKVHRGNVEQFFLSCPQRFDIVYLDACGPLASASQNTLRMVATLFRHHRLQSPGVLITNFALPDETNTALCRDYSELVAAYLYPKAFLECVLDDGTPGVTEGPVAHGILMDEDDEDTGEKSFLDQVSNDLPQYYGQYITRQLMDLACVITPWVRLLSSAYWPRLFCVQPRQMREKARDMLLAKDEDVGELFTEPDAYPLQWTLRWLCGDLRSDVSSNSMGPFAQQWVSQLAGTPTLKADAGVVAGIECYDVARSDGQFYSEALKAALAYQFRQLYQFCDVPTPTLLFDLLVNQLAFPLHYSTGSIRRWRYKAKQTTMFMDLVLFDECRYVYDWMPTIDLAGEGFSDVEQQLAYRFALDGLAKNRRWYNSEFFYGAAVVDQRLEGFEAKHLATRVEIP